MKRTLLALIMLWCCTVYSVGPPGEFILEPYALATLAGMDQATFKQMVHENREAINMQQVHLDSVYPDLRRGSLNI